MNDEWHTGIPLLDFPDEESQTPTYSDQVDTDDPEKEDPMYEVYTTVLHQFARDGIVEAIKYYLDSDPKLAKEHSSEKVSIVEKPQ
ncbi:unnamed protein product [Cylicocyclus nassatus]|uniref:Uncharacterized protein n=1 Tax=Cylicocyclus nassatus TaxID=53992 RepID=A0AA36MAE0_CYLNA|nr:unnamed protein product [Cylicocyclus nassatus]